MLIEVWWKDAVIGQFTYQNGHFSDYQCFLSRKHPYSWLKKVSKLTTAHGLENLLASRTNIGQNRQDLANNINLDDFFTVLNLNHFATLSDCLWLKCATDSVQWKDVNLYDRTNQDFFFSETIFHHPTLNNLATVTLTGYLPKYWHQQNQQWILTKFDVDRFPQAHTEVVVSKIWQLVTQTVVEYTPGLTPDSVDCPNFTNSDQSFIPMDWFLSPNSGVDWEIIQAIFGKDKLQEMLIFDLLINNIDRHLFNFGMIYDSRTNQFCCTPYFDHGLSLATGFDFHYQFLKRWSTQNAALTNDLTDKAMFLADYRKYEAFLNDPANVSFADFLQAPNKLGWSGEMVLKRCLTPTTMVMVNQIVAKLPTISGCSPKDCRIVHLNAQFISQWWAQQKN